MKYKYKIRKDNSSLIMKVFCIMIYSVFYIICIKLLMNYIECDKFIIAGLIGLYFILLVIPMFIFPMWCLTEKDFIIFQPKGFIEKWAYIIKKKASLSISLLEIDKIFISYQKSVSPFIYQEGYNVIFCIYLYNGDEICMDAMLNNDKQSFLDAISYLEYNNIELIDKYEIIQILKKGDKKLYNHLHEIEVRTHD